MNQQQEVELLKRCLELAEQGSTQLGESQGSSPVSRYTDASVFQAEVEHIFRKLPTPLAHVSQLSEDDSYLVVESQQGSILLTRKAAGDIRGFHNVCRHRGTRLVEAGAGCAQRFSCPYHAWTYANDGRLVGVPHEAMAFPELDREQAGLVPVKTVSRHGFIWLVDDEATLSQFLDGIEADLAWLDLASHVIYAEETKTWRCNWKIIAEGGLESYHFRQAHKATIAPYFYDNLSIYDRYGPHFRSVLPKRNMEVLKAQPESEWRLRDVSHMTYALLPMTTFLVQADHVVWIDARPLAADETRISIRTLVPAELADKTEYWAANHGITNATLDEDFALGESIQRGFANGANASLTFGRNEAALSELQQAIEALV